MNTEEIHPRGFACARAWLWGSVSMALGCVALAAQQAPQFRSGVSMVPVDVRVIDADGRPIRDLKQEDFVLKEDGVVQTIRIFSTHAFSADSRAVVGTPPLRGSAGPAVSPQNRRVYLLMLGRGRHQDLSNFVESLSSFVTNLLPQDLVAVLAWNRVTDFTARREVIVDLLGRYRDRHAEVEQELRMWFSGLRAVYGSREIPEHIQKLIDDVFDGAASLRPRPTVPASIVDEVRVSESVRRTGMAIQRNAEIASKLRGGASSLSDLDAELSGAEDPVAYMEQMLSTLQDVSNLYAAISYLRHLDGEKHVVVLTEFGMSLPDQSSHVSLARVASDARIALSVVRTRGTSAAPAVPMLAFGSVNRAALLDTTAAFAETFAIRDLREITDRTGGQFQGLRTGAEAFRRLEDSNAFQYLLGYTPARADLDGKFRRIAVDVNRRGARVMVREGYFADDKPLILDARELATFTRINAASRSGLRIDHLDVSLDSPVVTRQEVSVTVTVRIDRLAFTMRNDGRKRAEVDVALFAGDASGQSVGSAQHRLTLNFTEAEHARAVRDGVSATLKIPFTGVPRVVKVVAYDYFADLVGTNSIRLR